jgi:hypothetical protein
MGDYDWLENPNFLDRGGELVETDIIEPASRLIRVGLNLINWNLKQYRF